METLGPAYRGGSAISPTRPQRNYVGDDRELGDADAAAHSSIEAQDYTFDECADPTPGMAQSQADQHFYYARRRAKSRWRHRVQNPPTKFGA
jgi:hypothetical protein